MKKLLSLLLLLTFFACNNVLSQPWTSNSICDLTNGVQWNNGGATPCACTWYSVSGVDTILNCAYGDCGQSDLFECVYDCNGHNGNPTDVVPRTCDASASPICWYQGAGSTAGADFCAGIALSIELYEFWGSAVGFHNEIYWTTSSELDNDYFVVSYSKYGISFEDIGNIDGAGTTTQERKYRFIHGNPERGVGYYKLRQVDYNGEFEEFHIISINNNGAKTGDLFSEIYPNPSSNLFYFNYNGNVFNTPINIKIESNLGEIIREGVVDKYNSSQSISLDLTGVSRGVYLVKITQGTLTETKKIIVL